MFANGGPFDPKSYGGDAAKALAVRTAFLKMIPRQDIVDRLIKPLNPDAMIRDSYNVIPGSPNYDAITAANGMKDAHNGDIAAAKKILTDAGVDTSTPIKVRFMYADNNPRRANEYRLIAAAGKEAGFDVIDGKNADWSSQLPNTQDLRRLAVRLVGDVHRCQPDVRRTTSARSTASGPVRTTSVSTTTKTSTSG